MFYARIDKIKKMFRTVPLSWRLAFTAFVVSMATLTALNILFRNVIQSRLSAEYEINLNNHITEMADIIHEVTLHASNTHFSDRWIEAELQNWPYYTRLIDGDGKIIGETEGMPFSMEEVYSIIPDDKESISYRAPNGKPYTLVKSSVYAGIKFLGQIQVVRDITPEEGSRDKINDIFTWISVLGSILTGFFTLLIADGTLKPISRMSDKIESMTVAKLGNRLKNDPWPRELRSIAMAFDGMLDRFSDNFRRMSQFSSDLAHELRTPAHKMMVELDVTLSAERKAEEYKATLESLQEAVIRTNKMLEDMLFIARAENKVAAVKIRKLNAKQEVNKLADYLQVLLDEKNLKFDIDVSGSVRADETMFQRALSNLITNAVKHSPPGASIKIRGGVSASNFVVSVEDVGEGIKIDKTYSVFDRFYKHDTVRCADAPKSTKAAGTGLGLSIVRSIMVMHGGDAKAENVPGGGARFTLVFPIE